MYEKLITLSVLSEVGKESSHILYVCIMTLSFRTEIIHLPTMASLFNAEIRPTNIIR